MEEILHQLRLVVYPIIYQVLYIPGSQVMQDFFHQQYQSIPIFQLVDLQVILQLLDESITIFQLWGLIKNLGEKKVVFGGR